MILKIFWFSNKHINTVTVNATILWYMYLFIMFIRSLWWTRRSASFHSKSCTRNKSAIYQTFIQWSEVNREIGKFKLDAIVRVILMKRSWCLWNIFKLKFLMYITFRSTGTSYKAFIYFRVCVIKSVDSFNVSAFCVHECEGSNRMGSRPRRYLFTGHSNGAIQVSASSSNQNMIPNNPSLCKCNFS